MTTNAHPFVSVIIPTRNRQSMLEKALISMVEMQYPLDRFEVVVVDDGSTDGTRHLVAGLLADLPYSLIYVPLEGNGIPAARNAGASAAKGQLLVFSDDDCFFRTDWLAVLAANFSDPGIGVVGVADEVPEDSPLLSRCIDYTVNSLAGSGGVRHDRSLRIARYYPRGFGMAVSREAFEAVAGFDETLQAGEDIDLSYRIGRAGYRLRFEPKTFVWHQRRSTLKAFLKQMATRGATRVELIRRHPALLEPAFLVPAAMLFWFGGLALFSWVSPRLQWLLVVTAWLYGAALLLSGWRGARKMNEPRGLALIPVVTGLQHFGYGWGFLRGCIIWLQAATTSRPIQ